MKRLLLAIMAVSVLSVLSLAAASDVPLTPLEQLGKSLYFDKISQPNNQSCATCHAPAVGFTGPVPGVNASGAVYPGAISQRFGNRKPPAASYATFSPVFHFDADEGLFVGGNFWDGRATGAHLGNPAADQALGPFLNPVEQNNASKEAVLMQIAASQYASLWEEVWGGPVSWGTPAEIDLNYDRIGLAIASYEASYEVNPFSSKFDYFWNNAMEAGKDVTAINASNWMDYQGLGLDKTELRGFGLFNDENKGKCVMCHTLDAAGPGLPPLFTDNTFDNLGVPRNPNNPFYNMDEVYLDNGSPINPLGDAWVDPGLGGFLAAGDNPMWQAMAAENMGKHRVPTLRNVGKAPSAEFTKAYTHNGVFKSLEEVVHFYNTRDVADWAPPEVGENVNTDELGNLGLTRKEEVLIAAFMRTLSDGWKPRGLKSTGDQPLLTLSPQLTLSPNPFNPITRITYSVQRDGLVDVAVYDVAGRRVRVLAAGWEKAGTHTVEFSADRMASGVYFIRLATGGEVTTARAVLLK